MEDADPDLGKNEVFDSEKTSFSEPIFSLNTRIINKGVKRT